VILVEYCNLSIVVIYFICILYNIQMKNVSDEEIKPGLIEKSKLHTYKYIKRLGKGGFGEIWLAEDELKKLVAIKVYLKLSITDVKLEIENLKHISKYCEEYAVCYIDSYAKHNKWGIIQSLRIVMNYIDGGSIHEKWSDITPDMIIKRNSSNKIIFDLVLGINFLHSLNITHQDIKLENVMYDKGNDKYKYIDWGLACLKSLCNDKDNVKCKGPCGAIGTVDYTSPEKLEFYKKTKKSQKGYFYDAILHDVWSVGILLLNWYGGIKVKTDNYQNQLKSFVENENNNKLARCIIPLMLEPNKYNRAINWKPIIYFFKDINPEK